MCITIGKPMRNLRQTTQLLVVALVTLALTAAHADEPAVTAVLESSEATVGQMVQMQIKVTGARSASVPSEIAVDGLDIRYSGQSQLMEGHNFQFSYSVVYSYTIMAQKAGTYRIPPQSIRVGGKELRTPELKLHVFDGSSGPAGRSGRATDPVDLSKTGFIELVLTKTSAYVGEMIPAEVRIGFNTRTPVESLGNGIDLTGQGFTTQKMRDPRQTIENIRGRSYQTFVFKTAISPVRPGKIDVGPIEAHPIVRVPQTNRARPNMRDPFGFSDPFFDNFFNDPAFAPSTPREIKLKSETAVLDVKPLPPNAPPSFSGAVGIFTMTTEVKPTSGKVGDPITITARIAGRGNFDRVSAPGLENDKGWHKYPPSGQFKQDDDVGISGVKAFETVVSATERKDSLPPLVFTFFDPVKEQYVTLKSEATSLQIEGPSAPAATATPAIANAMPTARASVSPAASPAKADILYQLAEMPARDASFTPLYRRREFWLAQLVALGALAGYVVWNWRRRRRGDREAARIASLQHEAAELHRRLQRGDATPREYFADAQRSVQLKTALAKNIAPHAVDADVAATTFRLDEERRERLRRLFAESDELRYSGASNGSSTVPAERRRDVLDLIDSLRA